MHKFFNIEFVKFVFVGCINTLISFVIMLLLYDLFRMGYWGASSISYIVGSVVSFVLNKNFTFKNKDSISKTAIKFAVNVLVCYIIAYSIAKPFILTILQNSNLEIEWIEKIAMLFGMILFTCLNYIGQRFFAFRSKEI